MIWKCREADGRVLVLKIRKIFTVRIVLTEVSLVTSKLTTNAQTTVPQVVRAALDLKEGDEIAYTIANDHVILTKASRDTLHDPFATFEEWNGEADRRAYANL